jgi:hypothetical protein
VIVRLQRESASNRGFRHLARYIQGRDTKPRTTWFHAANLPGVSAKEDLELACKLVDAAQAQNKNLAALMPAWSSTSSRSAMTRRY